MIKRILKFFIFLFVLSVLSFAVYQIYILEKTEVINIIFTNDIHGHIFAEKEDTGFLRGGFPALSTFLKKEKNPYILVDAGDIFQGTPEGNFTKGKVIIDAMNYLGYKVMEIGNHEIDYGTENLKELSQKARFTFLGANFVREKDNGLPKWLKPYKIFKVGNYRIGFIGVVTSQLPKISIKENMKGFKVLEEIDTIKRYLKEIKENSDVVVGLTHVGLARKEEDFNDDRVIAKEVKELNIIIGGHTHNFLEKPIKIGKTYIVQSGCFLKSVGKISLRFNKTTKKLLSVRYELIPLYLKYYSKDKNLFDLLKSSLGDIYESMNVVIGENKRWLYRYLRGRERKNGELPLGDFITDVMREYTGTDFAFQNIGGIRTDLPEGEIKLRDIYMLHPFGNTIYTMELTGKQIRELMEESVSGSFGILQISGLKLIWDSYLPEGKRVLNVIVDGKEIEDEKQYTIATNSFLAQGGDEFTVFLEGKEVEDKKVLLREIMIEYIKNNSPIEVKKDKRIINVSIE